MHMHEILSQKSLLLLKGYNQFISLVNGDRGRRPILEFDALFCIDNLQTSKITVNAKDYTFSIFEQSSFPSKRGGGVGWGEC